MVAMTTATGLVIFILSIMSPKDLHREVNLTKPLFTQHMNSNKVSSTLVTIKPYSSTITLTILPHSGGYARDTAVNLAKRSAKCMLTLPVS